MEDVSFPTDTRLVELPPEYETAIQYFVPFTNVYGVEKSKDISPYVGLTLNVEAATGSDVANSVSGTLLVP